MDRIDLEVFKTRLHDNRWRSDSDAIYVSCLELTNLIAEIEKGWERATHLERLREQDCENWHKTEKLLNPVDTQEVPF